MIAVKDLLEFQGATTPITRSKMWEKDVATITPEEVVAFMKVQAMKGHGHTGVKDIESLLAGVRRLIASREIETARLEMFNLPTRTYNVHTLYEELKEFSLARRHAIVVSILSGLSLAEVVTLKRKDVPHVDIDDKSREIISQYPSHIQTEYVFWEYKGSRLSLLFDLPDEYQLISNHDVEHYRDNLAIDTDKMSDEDYWLFRRAFWKDFLAQF